MPSRRREDAYEEGYDDGYEEGYDEGYEDGEPEYDDEYRGGGAVRSPVLPWAALVTLTCLLSAMGGR
jgi:hypothetical protein